MLHDCVELIFTLSVTLYTKSIACYWYPVSTALYIALIGIPYMLHHMHGSYRHCKKLNGKKLDNVITGIILLLISFRSEIAKSQ